jgi:hypothetical protein
MALPNIPLVHGPSESFGPIIEHQGLPEPSS